MLNIENIRYPSLNRIAQLYPSPEVVLNRIIYWTEKRDGINLGVYLDEKEEINVRTRNLIRGERRIIKILQNTKQYSNIKDLLTDRFVVFGELLMKGKSPTRIEFHKEDQFIIFDIWSLENKGFLTYNLMKGLTNLYELPTVQLYTMSLHKSLDSLFNIRDDMLSLAKVNGREGVVGKVYENGTVFKYFKEKIMLPKLIKTKVVVQDKPELPEFEIMGSVSKVFADLSLEDFKNVRIAMPMIANYAAEESKKHGCSKCKNLFRFYQLFLEEI